MGRGSKKLSANQLKSDAPRKRELSPAVRRNPSAPMGLRWSIANPGWPRSPGNCGRRWSGRRATAGILQIIASSPPDVQPVFEAIVRSANTLIGWIARALILTVLLMVLGHLEAAFTRITTPPRMKCGLSGATFPPPVSRFPAVSNGSQAGEATQVARSTERPCRTGPAILGILRGARGFRSIMFAPMMSDGVSIGSIAVTRVQPGTFADHHVQLLQTFADQAVIAIENVRLFEQVQAKTRDLSESLEPSRPQRRRFWKSLAPRLASWSPFSRRCLRMRPASAAPISV